MWKLAIALVMLVSGAVAQPVVPACINPADNGCLSLAALQRLTAFNVSANGPLASVPANAVIRAIYIRNTTANAVTGGINIGTAAGGAQVASAIAVAGNALVVIDGASLVSTGKYLSATLNTVIYISAVTAWNSAALDIRIQMDQ